MTTKKRNPAHSPVDVQPRPEPPHADHSPDETGSSEARPGFPIVGVGASAGGLEALNQLLKALPEDTGMGVVLVQHLAPSHASNLAGILSRATRMKVTEIKDESVVEPNQIYVIPPGQDMVISKGTLRLQPRESRGPQRPIDLFLRSLAQDRAHKAIGVILSGTSNDGTLGLEEIKAEGGLTFAQDATAQYDGMPRSAADAGCVDYVLPPDEIAKELARIARHPFVAPPERIEEGAPAPGITKVLQILRSATNVDFTHYKGTTLYRRIARRMVLQKMEGMQDYSQLLRGNPDEIEALYQDILINVTSFFRNPEVFEALKTTVFPQLFQGRSSDDPLRVWVLGCSTGEEPYSVAISFLEFLDGGESNVPVQIFATDLNGQGIEKARTGVFSKNITDVVSPQRLRRFFVEVDGGYRVIKTVRDMCVFARHNVLADPPFSKIDLISCRNLFIYLEPTLQQRVLPLLHYALKPNAFLLLGASETVGPHRNLFAPEDAQHKIFAKRPGSGRLTLNVAAKNYPTVPADFYVAPGCARENAPAGGGGTVEILKEADRLLLARFVPPAVLVNTDLEILHFRGDTSPYLAPPPGTASLNVLKMAREGLLMALRSTITKARKEKATVREEGLRIRAGDGIRTVNLEVVPVRGNSMKDGGFLILFEEAIPVKGRPTKPKSAAALKKEAVHEEINRLNQELAATRDYLQSVIEQQEAANEELQSASEEVQSTNEELQSINEELETSKEEIQSSNEELATVNDELRNQNAELGELNNDFVNLFTSVDKAILMVGRDLRIRRFTPRAEQTLDLIPTDIGRSIDDIRFTRDLPELETWLNEVITSAVTTEHEIQDGHGRWYSLHLHPYKTLDNKIEGAVIVLVDVNELKHMMTDLVAADRSKNQFLAMLAHELRNPLAPLRNAVHVLNTPEASPADLEHARGMMERNVGTMSRMIEDLLDASRITQGRIQLRKEPIELAVILARAASSIRPELEERGQSLDTSLPPGPIHVDADPTRLEQVFTNLLNNASKFGNRGGQIWVNVAAPAVDSVVVRVRDDGIGIAPEFLPKVFDLFRQIDDSLVRSQHGLGIGLTLVRNLVELHGGQVEARSSGLGQGSEFVVTLPVMHSTAIEMGTRGRSAQRVAGDRPESAPLPHRILIVDDNVDSTESLAMMLRLRGHQAEIARNGPRALDLAATFKPEVVVLDISLPGLDGYEVARQLRQRPATAKAVLIALTGYGRPEDRDAAAKAGFDKHFTKPLEPAALYDYLAGIHA